MLDQLEEIDLEAPGSGVVHIEQTVIGLDYMDVNQCSGTYLPTLPSRLGLEAEVRVIAIGSDASDVSLGGRVARDPVLGAYVKHLGR
ncbi:MAG: hypothetical protein AAF543_05195 [Pseudomonadota bacterium]